MGYLTKGEIMEAERIDNILIDMVKKRIETCPTDMIQYCYCRH